MNQNHQKLFNNLRKFINLIDELRDVGLDQHIKLPRIATLGGQSAGKSSLLESVVGLDFLPRNEGVCTRRPLELRLVHKVDVPKPYAVFEKVAERFTNFDDVRKKIQALTDEVAGVKHNIIDKPIQLTIYSADAPDLTIIDLPGITRIPLLGSEQPENIEQITTELALKYVKDDRTIILCVIPANQDLSTSDALKLARQVDPQGNRTLGVITKIDIMDKGSNCKKVLMNQEIHLKLGYVGVKNRNQQDINENKRVLKALEEEKLFFAQHPVYSTVSQGTLGTEVLTQKLTNLLYEHIRLHLPEIMSEIQQKMEEVNDRLRMLGPSIPETDTAKQQALWDIVSRFSISFTSSIEGKFQQNQKSTECPEGSRIRLLFNEIYREFLPLKASTQYENKDIQKAITLHEGDSLPGFHSSDAFNYLLDPVLDRLYDPAHDLLQEVFVILEKLCQNILGRECTRFPDLLLELGDRIVKILDTERESTKYIIDDMIDSETKYLFTNDKGFVSDFFQQIKPKQQEEQQQLTEEKVKLLLIQEMRAKMDLYFKIVVRNLRDRIPKIIGYFFIKRIQKNMQMQLIKQLNEEDSLSQFMQEPLAVKEERKRLNDMLNVLKNSQKIIKRDPDLALGAHHKYKKVDQKSDQIADKKPEVSTNVNNNAVRSITPQRIPNQQQQQPQQSQQQQQQQPQANSLFGNVGQGPQPVREGQKQQPPQQQQPQIGQKGPFDGKILGEKGFDQVQNQSDQQRQQQQQQNKMNNPVSGANAAQNAQNKGAVGGSNAAGGGGFSNLFGGSNEISKQKEGAGGGAQGQGSRQQQGGNSPNPQQQQNQQQNQKK